MDLHSRSPRPSKPRSRSTRPARPKKLKSVTYTGCWTCRSRKTKCDERQENGCGICERSGLKCAGYDVNLYWVTGKREVCRKIHRRSLVLDRTSSIYLPDEQVDEILSTLDSIDAPSNTVSMGSFSIFNARTTGNSAKTADESDELIVRPRCIVSCSPSSPHSELSLPLFQDSEISLLLYHYKDHVAGLLQPVLHPENPWRTTYVPFALEGRPDLLLAQNPAPSSTASTAIFHGLLSSAAFHIRNLTGGSERFNNLGFRHRTKALQALKTALVDTDDPHLYTVQLTAMLSLVTIDTITGEDADFPIHLKGCRQLRECHESKAFGGPSQKVNNICHFLTLLGRTTSPELQVTQVADKWCLEKPLFSSSDTHIEYIYGITPTLGNLLHRTCQISEAVSTYDRQHIPKSLQNARNALRAELLTWSLATDDCHLVNSEAAINMLDIIRRQACAFHSAVLIFYYRAIENHDLINPQLEVLTVWENLTIAEQNKEHELQKQRYGAPMSWPAFIAACEAVNRQPWAEWWAKVQRYNLGNFRRQWIIIQEVWGIMDSQDICWRDALQQCGKLVLPI
ncbi:uncharacterized protein N7503_009676 [Penicillium pulvis]|uniref:uncharacterized protein n=1 Tax=Penicillium pulvis TaxID=1562058 RepID=UPI0025480ADE|nr:uncharacterized protein N7503_009676 [Penicillium pulvis]KAJ5784464.1 hypothetical protein N7503_009676 [Penicillium pulvis]